MEIINAIRNLKMLMASLVFALLFLGTGNCVAQTCTIRDGKMYIEIKKDLTETALDNFIKQYDLADLALKYFIRTNSTDSLTLMGWKLNKNDRQSFAISKDLVSAEDLTNLAGKIYAEIQPGFRALFPATNNGLLYGYNKFKNKFPFAVKDSITTFYLRNNLEARKVTLAGSFNDWQTATLPMTRTDSGWIADVKLGQGKYWYKFIVDNKWMLDADNFLRENDGLGNANSVYYKANHTFILDGYKNTKKVFLAGSFNNWNADEMRMMPTPTGWKLPVYLADGTHTYRYVIDGDWKTDPANPDRLPNEFNDFNSVIRLGTPYVFKLEGHADAKRVLLTGSFNGWRKDELFMNRTASGWELPYTLTPGNYEYRFIVDGKEIRDPANPLSTNQNRKNSNSYLILDPNYTFHLKGYANAKTVYLGGDFNGFSPNSLAMKRVGDEWIFSIHLSRGKHLYKFIVDGKWIIDPNNKLWEQNEYETGNSVIWIEK